MFYYEVLVGDMQFHGDAALTYSWDAELSLGQIVRIALRSRSVLGIIQGQVGKPDFPTKNIAAVADAPPIPKETLLLLDWLQSYYPAPFGAIVRQFMPPSVSFPKKLLPGPTQKNYVDFPPLTELQTQAMSHMSEAGSYLLHGITGSGKTRVYLELAQKTLQKNRSVIILTPEIGLTESLVRAFSALPAPVFVLHSRLTVAARRDVWFNILHSKDTPCIVIGPRSALFIPLHNVGLVVMDEAHDQAYKSDSQPRYRTDRVAATLATYHDAIFVRGSATPNIEDMHLFKEKKSSHIIQMKTTALPTNTSDDSAVIVDMRDHTNFVRSKIISKALHDAMSTALTNGEQSMLFLNRRGTASAILCASCGWRAMCPHCDLPMTYHGDKHQLQCHVCGRHQPLMSSCPKCKSVDIFLKSIGTKAVVDEAKRLFPAASIHRFDTDTSKDEQIENQLESLQDGKVDIIVGTQMITKGLDLPRLSVVGILNADASLMIPDYSANERTYQLLNQVAGRVGRGHRAGTIILQTYDTANPLFKNALTSNWEEFYTKELSERKQFLFPPFVFLLKLWCLRATPAASEKTASQLAIKLTARYPHLHVEGPSPSFHPKESGKYKWQLVIKSTSRQALLAIVADLPSGWNYDLDPVNLL